MTLPILQSGRCEPFKAGVHAAALGLAVVMGLYNTAAWLHRRQRHLWINAMIYCLVCEFERRHVGHHLEACRPLKARAATTPLDAAASNDTPHAA